MQFFIPIIPTAQARGRAGINKATGRALIYHGKNQNRNSRDLIALMAPFAPETPLEGPLELTVIATRPISASWPKKKQASAIDKKIYPTVTPDLDNYLKQVMDCMTALRFWNDDKQVVFILARKEYGENPGWRIHLEEIK